MNIDTEEDQTEFAACVRRHAQKAYGFAYRLAGNEADARDLVQEAFMHALKHFDKFDRKRPFEPWFNRILKNIFLDSMRRYQRKHVVSLDGPSPIEAVAWENILPGSDVTPEKELEKQEQNVLVQKALDQLPIHCKTAVILCDIEKHPYERIAEILGCPIGTVRSRIHQGRVLLRKAFENLQFGIQANDKRWRTEI